MVLIDKCCSTKNKLFEKISFNMKKAIFIAVIYLIVQLALFYIFSTVGMLLISNTMDVNAFAKTSAYYWTIGVTTIFTNLLLIMIVYFTVSKESLRPFKSYLLMPRGIDFIYSLLTFIVLMFVLNSISDLTNIRDTNKNLLDGMMHNWLCLFDILIVGSIANEICFRRGILGSLLRSPRFHHHAIIISAAIFALMQFNPASMLVAFVFGLFLGWIYRRTHSLVLPIIFDIINNLIGVLLNFFLGKDIKMISLFPNATVFYVCLGGCVLATFVFFRLMNKKMYRPCVVDDL